MDSQGIVDEDKVEARVALPLPLRGGTPAPARAELGRNDFVGVLLFLVLAVLVLNRVHAEGGWTRSLMRRGVGCP